MADTPELQMRCVRMACVEQCFRRATIEAFADEGRTVASGREGPMAQEYVDQHDGGYWVAGSRVSLDSIVTCFLEGLSPETIVADCFPVLTLEQVYGAITYYLAHRAEVDAYLTTSESEEQAFRAEIRARYPRVHHRLDELLETPQARER